MIFSSYCLTVRIQNKFQINTWITHVNDEGITFYYWLIDELIFFSSLLLINDQSSYVIKNWMKIETSWYQMKWYTQGKRYNQKAFYWHFPDIFKWTEWLILVCNIAFSYTLYIYILCLQYDFLKMETDDFHIEYLFKNMFSLQFSWSWDKRVFIFLRHPVHEPVNLLNQKKRKQVLLLKFCRKQGKLSYFAKCHVYVPCSYCNLLVGSNLKSWTYLNMLLAPGIRLGCIYNTHNTLLAW